MTIIGAADTGTITIVDAAPMAASSTYPEYGHPGKLRDHILRRSVDLPVVDFPNRLDVHIPRFLCTVTSCPGKIFQTPLACTDGGPKLAHRVTRWILRRLAVDRVNILVTAKAPGTDWDLISQVVLGACRQLAYDDPHHLDGVYTLGVDEYAWRRTRKLGQSSNLMTVLIDLTPLVDGRGPARLLDLRPGHSAEVLRAWLQRHDPSSHSQVQMVTMDGFTDYASAVNQVLPDATKMVDLFRVVHLAADKLTSCRQRFQRETTGRRRRKGDPLHKYHWTLLTGADYLTQRQKQ